MGVTFEKIDRALASLEEGLQRNPEDKLLRDGVIQRFEYTFELAWKLGQKALEEYGVRVVAPKPVIRAIARQGWIDDADAWMSFLSARNLVAHVYNDDVAATVFAVARDFAPACDAFVARLKGELGR